MDKVTGRVIDGIDLMNHTEIIGEEPLKGRKKTAVF